ncbi:MAG: diguanylate cyclase, partial [Oscillospiraceae bacterium]|nr:diguanylate cyclase [Oscillospiraceae bacterium]
MYIDYNYQKMEDRYLDTDLSAQLLSCDSLNTLVKTMYSHQFVYLEPEYCERKIFCLCLCEDWNRSRNNGDPRRTWGYPDEMLQMDFNGKHVVFPRSDMLPPGLQQYRSPSVTLFTAIHFQDRCFGYTTLLLDGIADGYNAHYLRFCREVTNALEFVRVQNELRSLAYHNLLTQVRDTMTGLYNLRSLPHIWDDYLRTAHEQRFWIGLSIGGLYRLTETRGSLQKDKLLVTFAEQLQNACSQGEKCLRAGESDFLILGSEPSTSHYHNLLIQNIREKFEQYMNSIGMPILPLQYAVELGDALPTEAVGAEQAALALLQNVKSVHPSYSEQLHYAKLAELRRNIYKYPEKNWSLAGCSA